MREKISLPKINTGKIKPSRFLSDILRCYRINRYNLHSPYLVFLYQNPIKSGVSMISKMINFDFAFELDKTNNSVIKILNLESNVPHSRIPGIEENKIQIVRNKLQGNKYPKGNQNRIKHQNFSKFIVNSNYLHKHFKTGNNNLISKFAKWHTTRLHNLITDISSYSTSQNITFKSHQRQTTQSTNTDKDYTPILVLNKENKNSEKAVYLSDQFKETTLLLKSLPATVTNYHTAQIEKHHNQQSKNLLFKSKQLNKFNHDIKSVIKSRSTNNRENKNTHYSNLITKEMSLNYSKSLKLKRCGINQIFQSFSNSALINLKQKNTNELQSGIYTNQLISNNDPHSMLPGIEKNKFQIARSKLLNIRHPKVSNYNSTLLITSIKKFKNIYLRNHRDTFVDDSRIADYQLYLTVNNDTLNPTTLWNQKYLSSDNSSLSFPAEKFREHKIVKPIITNSSNLRRLKAFNSPLNVFRKLAKNNFSFTLNYTAKQSHIKEKLVPLKFSNDITNQIIRPNSLHKPKSVLIHSKSTDKLNKEFIQPTLTNRLIYASPQHHQSNSDSHEIAGNNQNFSNITDIQNTNKSSISETNINNKSIADAIADKVTKNIIGQMSRSKIKKLADILYNNFQKRAAVEKDRTGVR